MDFSNALKVARERAGLTQQQVAERMSLDKSTYCGYETGKRMPDVKKIKMLISILDVPASELLGIEKQTPSNKRELDKEEEELIRLYRQCSKDDRKCALQVVRNFAELETRRTQEEAPHGSGTDTVLQSLRDKAQQKDSRTEFQDASKKQ